MGTQTEYPSQLNFGDCIAIPLYKIDDIEHREPEYMEIVLRNKVIVKEFVYVHIDYKNLEIHGVEHKIKAQPKFYQVLVWLLIYCFIYFFFCSVFAGF